MNFTGAVLTQTQNPLVLVDNICVPNLRDGQVLVKIEYAGVCHSQLMEQQGKRGEDKYLPHFLGHEGTGVVVDVGAKVSKVAVGDNVVLGWIKGQGLDEGGTQYASPIGTINAGAVTTFSEYSVVSENRCYPLPSAISKRHGVLLGCALPTGMGMAINNITQKEGLNIGIVGLGGIGISALMAAKTFSPSTLVAIDINSDKFSFANELGATHCLVSTAQGINESVMNITDGKGFDYVFEAAGSAKTIELAFSLLNKHSGKCVFASHPPAGEKISLDPFELICGKQIKGTWGGNAKPEEMCQFVAHSVEHSNLDAFLSKEYTLDQINTAFEDLQQKRILRALIKVSE